MKKIDFSKLNKQKIKDLIETNLDTRLFFYTQIDEAWIDWLWSEGFLDPIKEKGEDLERWGYVTPELDYLVRMAKLSPNKVADLMLQVPITEDAFNPEVADRFLWIAGELPAEQLIKIVPKINNEGWVKLLSRYRNSAFEYERMFEKLTIARDYETLLTLAEAVILVRPKEEDKEKINKFGGDDPFYLTDIGHTTIFEKIVEVDDAHLERALAISTEAMKNIVLLGNKGSDTFDIDEVFYLFDVDFFTLHVKEKRSMSYRDDVKNLAAVVKEVVEKIINIKKTDAAEVKRIFNTYIDTMPNSRSMWRLRLFAVSLDPDTFTDFIKDYSFKIFDDKKWNAFITGAEYENFLKTTFHSLSNTDRHTYIQQVFDFFGKPTNEKFMLQDGLDLLSCIDQFLSEDQRNKATEVFSARPNEDYKPSASIGQSYAGTINPQSPVTEETLNGLSISELVSQLKEEWSPANIRKKDTVEDFLRPVNAEGLTSIIQKNMCTRLQEYLNDATLFFDRETLHPQYTHAFLRGTYDAIRDSGLQSNSYDFAEVLMLLSNISKSGNIEPFQPKDGGKSRDNGWLANWSWVHNDMGDLIKDLVGENKEMPLVEIAENREVFLEVLDYLLHFPDPEPDDNFRKNGGDPFTTAINSVRGRAFQALAVFVFFEDKLIIPKDQLGRISSEVKDIYEGLLDREDTLAIMFMFGHTFATFYYRDKEWITSILQKIFPAQSKPDLYIASWEGYLSSPLYRELFIALEAYYREAITLTVDKEARRYFKQVDEALATHLALAYMHFEDFTTDSPLFKEFWDTPNTDQLTEFVSFIGSYSISRDSSSAFRVENKIDSKKLELLWDWIIANCDDQKVFSGFGFWVVSKSDTFDQIWLAEHTLKTLEKSGGRMKWEYGMMRSLSDFARVEPKSTLKILELYLIESSSSDQIYQSSIYIESEMFETLTTLYANSETKLGVEILINKLLLVKNSTRYWKLAEILPKK